MKEFAEKFIALYEQLFGGKEWGASAC